MLARIQSSFSMCLFISFWTHEIDSTPPATTMSFSPAMTRCAAIAIVCRPLEQKRFTVMPLVVIGKPARRVLPKDAADCIFGWTIGNDLTERDWQRDDPTNLRGKNADTFKPMGPWIVTGIDPRDMTKNVRLNGKTVHSFPTGNMLFSAAEVISDVSRYNTLSPRDVVWLGTDEVPHSVKPGDVIEIEITGIGVLRNRVVAEA